MQRQLTQEEQRDQENLLNAGQAKATAHAVDLFNLAGIFLVKGLVLLEPFFEVGLKFAMLPLASLSIGVMTGITWYEAYKQKFAAYPVFKAVIETVKFLAITTAVIGALAMPVYFGLAGPAIFAVTFAAMTIINLGTAIYNGIMAAKTVDPIKKAEYRARAIDSVKGFIVGTAATAAITAVMIFKMPILTVLGVTAGVAGGVLAVVKYNDLSHAKAALKAHAEAAAPAPAEQTRSNNAELAQTFGLSKDGYAPLPTEDYERKPATFALQNRTSAPTLYGPKPLGDLENTEGQQEFQKPQRTASTPL